MTIHLGIVTDPIESIDYNKDSPRAMLWAAQDRAWQLFYMKQADLYSLNGQVMGRCGPTCIRE
jgi:glutathione synthase